MRPVRIGVFLAVLAAVVAGLSRISFDVDVFKILPPGLHQAEGLRTFLEHFAREDEMLVTVEAADAETAAQTADRVAAALSARPDLVARVTHRPRWETHGAELSELAAYLVANAPPDAVAGVVARTAPDRIDGTLQETLTRLAESASPAEVVQLGYDPLRFRETLPGAAEAARGAPGEFASPDGTFRVLYVEAAAPFPDYRAAIRWVKAVEDVARAADTGGVTLGFTGEPVFLAEISAGMDFDMKISGVTALAIIAGLFWLCYRRFKPLAALVALLVLVFVLSLAAAGLLLEELTVIGVGFAAIMIGLSVDFGYLIYQQWVEHGGSAEDLRRRCRPNIFWASVTTAASFFLLTASSLPGLSQLGTLVGLGVVIGALVMYFFYARFVARLPWKPAKPSRLAAAFWSPRGTRIGAWGTAGLIAALTVALVVAGGPQLDDTPRALRPRHSPANDALERLSERLADQKDPLSVVVTGRTEAEVLDRLQRIGQRIADVGGPETTFTSPLLLWPNAENQRANLPRLAELARRGPELRAALERAGFSAEAMTLTDAASAYWQTWAAATGPVWPDNESSRWLLRRVASRGDGDFVALGLLHPAPGRTDALAALREVGVSIVSWQQLGAELRRTVPREFAWLIGLMAAATFGLLVIGLRRLGDVLLLAVAMGLTFLSLAGAMAVLGMEWNFFNLAAILLLLGTGVDYPLHMTLALRGNLGDPRAAQATMGRVIFLCAASAAVGFGSISWASNYGLASLGRTCALGLALDALIAVNLLPVLWKIFRRGG
jgi:predicted exporter